MPRDKSQAINFKGFAQIQLLEADIEQIEEHLPKSTEYLQSLLHLVPYGYKLAFTRDSENGTYTATLFDNRKSSPTAGWMLSGDADTLEGAITVLAYKHYNKANEVWLPFLQANKPALKYR